ncbi:MAG: sigma-70 family RNA polymerase sigma factor [Acutalibacteraceae bacterium]|nr:sigma-70 family RNA polymerase sigma factor [Acutalibacteraceae bacterium]
MERRLIALLQKRDESVLQELRRIYGGLCFSLAYNMLGSREDAEECVNDMLLAVWNSVPPHDPVSLEAYLVTLVRRAAMDRLRSQTRQKRGGKQFAQALDELSEILPSDERVESEVEQRELARVLKAFLNTLPADTRHIFFLRYYMSAPVKQIASETGMQQSAVKMTLLRTRKKLKEYLEKEGML